MLIIQAKGRENLKWIEMDQAQLCLGYFMNILTRTMRINSVLIIEAHLFNNDDLCFYINIFLHTTYVLQHNKLPLFSREASLCSLYM